MGDAQSSSQSTEIEPWKLQYLAAHEIAQVEKARVNLFDFTRYTFPRYQANWHHKLIAKYLEELVSGEIDRLMITAPPRHGKSELVSRRLPAYALGRNPNEQIITASYSDTLASKMNRDTQAIMESREYYKVFPETLIPRKGLTSKNGRTYLRNSDEFEIMDQAGTYKSAGVGTGITGRGFTLGIIDDPFKDRKEADSETIRNAVYDWYTSTFLSRAEKNARILLTMTRWHEDDLVARILKHEPGEWMIISLPASYTTDVDNLSPLDPRDPDEALWPEKYSAKRLSKIKQASGRRDWAALWQGTPRVEGGNIVERGWWRFYKEAPAKFDEVIFSWDMAFKDTDGSDFVVGQVWGRREGEKFLLDQVREKMAFTATARAMVSLSAKWPNAYRKIVEDKANGTAVIDILKKKVLGLVPFDPKASKEGRAHAVSPQIEAGNVWLPDPSIAPWVHDYVEEWAAFPNGKNDDQVDATSQALLYFADSGFEKLERLLDL